MDELLTILPRFLNHECIWRLNPASSSYIKVYNATTAVSPYFKPIEDPIRGRRHHLNVTVLIMKQKKSAPCITVYVNERLVLSCSSFAVYVRKLPDPRNLFLIFFGKLLRCSSNFRIPKDPSILPIPEHPVIPTKQEFLALCKLVDLPITDILDHNDIKCIGGCTWFWRSMLFQYFIIPDHMMLLPILTDFPSLNRILNLLTRCENQSCVPCYGTHIHVSAWHGYTHQTDIGTSTSCPCILSCGLINGLNANITGNRNLLSLLFDPCVHHQITGLKILHSPNPVKVEDLVVGIKKDGTYEKARSNHWQLFSVSELLSRICIYNCQVLKRICLHSY
ncbi:member of UL16 family [Saguinine gammaherpesvirus 1]|uniref:Member of UL16 family n=1 Tax=Saguinine gammaherpesvirus 1 TaxID=2169901 RepID=A0A9Q8QUS0_9GAMA|nr:member of UL16 family [Saguinine gammaherpesvirus 1]